MNEKEAELIGAHIGDGTLYLANKKTIVWELRGSVDEKDYYEHIKSLIKDVLNVDVNPKYRGVNSYGIQTTNKTITNFFLTNGFKPGSKLYTVSIPDYIKKNTKEIQLSFIRGLFDTDGCVRFDKNRTNFYYYPRIEFGLASKQLIEDLYLLLNKLEFRSYKWKHERKDGISFNICLAGFANLQKWIENIRPANSKHLTRIKVGLSNKHKINLKNVSKNL